MNKDNLVKNVLNLFTVWPHYVICCIIIFILNGHTQCKQTLYVSSWFLLNILLFLTVQTPVPVLLTGGKFASFHRATSVHPGLKGTPNCRSNVAFIVTLLCWDYKPAALGNNTYLIMQQNATSPKTTITSAYFFPPCNFLGHELWNFISEACSNCPRFFFLMHHLN